MKTNIVPFKRRTTAPIQNNQPTLDYQAFLFSVFVITECFEVMLPKLVPFDTSEQSTIDFYYRHLSIVRNFTKQ
jgi:hypothetical protein